MSSDRLRIAAAAVDCSGSNQLQQIAANRMRDQRQTAAAAATIRREQAAAGGM